MDKKEKQLLHRELETYEDMGVLLYLNGRSTTPKRIEKAYRIAEGWKLYAGLHSR